jgi:hypothetical protein
MPSDTKRAGSISEKSVWSFKRGYKSFREARGLFYFRSAAYGVVATGTTSPGHYWEGRRKPEPRANESRRLPLNLFSSVAFATGSPTPPPSLSWSNMPLTTP